MSPMIADNRRGKKRGERILKRPPPVAPIPDLDPSSVPSLRQRLTDAGTSLDGIIQDDNHDHSHRQVSQSPVNPQENPISENNEDFFLMRATGKTVYCHHCKNEILTKSVLDADCLCFKHNERFIYPRSKGPGNKWMETALSRRKTLPFYYHAKVTCIYSHFRRQYFDNMPLHIMPNVVDSISSIIGFTHPKLCIQ